MIDAPTNLYVYAAIFNVGWLSLSLSLRAPVQGGSASERVTARDRRPTPRHLKPAVKDRVQSMSTAT